jgi:hypothetical protein
MARQKTNRAVSTTTPDRHLGSRWPGLNVQLDARRADNVIAGSNRCLAEPRTNPLGELANGERLGQEVDRSLLKAVDASPQQLIETTPRSRVTSFPTDSEGREQHQHDRHHGEKAVAGDDG